MELLEINTKKKTEYWIEKWANIVDRQSQKKKFNWLNNEETNSFATETHK